MFYSSVIFAVIVITVIKYQFDDPFVTFGKIFLKLQFSHFPTNIRCGHKPFYCGYYSIIVRFISDTQVYESVLYPGKYMLCLPFILSQNNGRNTHTCQFIYLS